MPRNENKLNLAMGIPKQEQACIKQHNLRITGNWTSYTGTKTNKEKTSGIQRTIWNVEYYKIYTETKINEE